ncbi:MAG: hypothetical protein ABW086_11420 [Sedimenticola sp.]
MKTTVFILLSAVFFNANACSIAGAKVIEVFQWESGNIFIKLDRNSSCPCEFPNRFGFSKKDDEKFFITAALTAMTTGASIYAAGDAACSVHGNTARLTRFSIRK